MGEYKRMWWALIVTLLVTFSVLGWMGKEVYYKAPPIPSEIVTTDGQVVMTEAQILAGQRAWQSVGGMDLGSVLGHGAYQAPDWTADWLHRELLAWLDIAAKDQYGIGYDELDPDRQVVLERQVKLEYRQNTVDDATNRVTITPRRAQAIAEVNKYYDSLFSDDPETHTSRVNFAMKENTLPSAEGRERLGNFFFWSAWAAATERSKDGGASYTNNWPHEPLVDNVPTAENMIWSLMSILLLIFGVGMLVWAWAFMHKNEPDPEAPAKDPVLALPLTPSQRALGKYLFVVVVLFVAQIFIGGFVAHYTVEGQTFYGINVSEWLPYSLVRTWHLQAAIFWIATGFLAAGLFLVPILNGSKDPAGQKLGVDILFWALIVVVVGSFTGNFMTIGGLMPEDLNFLLGHQGYEYLELGRLWQIALFIGILLWLVLMLRGLIPALKQKGDKNLLVLFTGTVVCVGLFYGTGLFYGQDTHITIMEYWRWWVVHLWVEGFFEVFATVTLAFIFATMGLVSKRGATMASLAAAILFMLGGTPGTMHHLYFAGTTTPILAIGAMFSALEVVPLVLLGYEAWDNWRLKARASWMENLKWPLMCFVAVAFWNMLGAGVFGFMINPPIALYYTQGLNTTPVHAHTALFGVYGFLALGFTLFVLRYIRPEMVFNEKLMKWSFWTMNIGLVMMVALSLLPIGLIQFHASYSVGMWWARSETFMQQEILHTLRWVRTFGDVVFIVGGVGVMWQVVSTLFGWDRKEAVKSN
ncbi:nitric-oxide reductase large subunit [Orrella sp. 11846]|uniref:nitric-oxide reductase large subunit n=1 Tax=Orrella sp. 11846 TaxID=3409913 RepID=UPI003B5C8B47